MTISAKTFLRRLSIAIVAAICGTAPEAFGKSGDPNPIEVIVGNGPVAGTYHSVPSETICMWVKGQQFSASYKNFDALDSKTMGEAGVNVTNFEGTTPKTGEVRLSFGDPAKSSVIYDIKVPADDAGPLNVTKTGATVTLAFEGKTKDGIKISVSALCQDIEEV